MTRRRTILPLLVAILLGAIGWTLSSSAAYAGGPTSVLMTSPQLGRASALHIQNPLYDRLYAAVGEEVAGDPTPPSGVNLSGEDDVRLTWLIHDMQIWRIDRLHLTRNDGIWVQTVTDLAGTGDVFDRPARWHHAADERALTALLTDAGLLGDAPAPSSPTGPDSTAEATTAASSTPSRPAAAIVGAALGGLAVGAAGSLLIRRRRTVDRPKVTLTG